VAVAEQISTYENQTRRQCCIFYFMGVKNNK